ncbi:TetR/AcrR family transcriptional regulator [Actinokineospora bangkokensis]|uniref:TetR family transcriptional regulator n=1 Tax=Actinokineospora bangkokensis TaxID=1193682 RepID=A0A1Q9LG30_9PSEU|nr:TetR/AcrR family transcriptional regulator [Actinokineospora bangkokensis]OLR91002.1 TetR family transcriptional regulator [Actinokineospora bangkokensis]
MARPRTITDERLLTAATAVIARGGPGFTLAQVADEAGVAVGTVAGRFGSKLGLLRALTEHTTAEVVAAMRAARSGVDPVAGVRAALVGSHADLGDAASAANHLRQLGVDLSTPELSELLAAHFAAVEEELRAAVEAAALPGAPPPRVAARVLLSLVNGVSLDWSLRPVGTLVDRLSEDVDAVLAGWHR